MRRISSKMMITIICCCFFTAFLIGGFSLFQSTNIIKSEASSKLTYKAESSANQFSQTFIKSESYVDSLQSSILATFDMKAFQEDPYYLDKYEKNLDAIMRQFASNSNDCLGIYVTFNPYLTKRIHEVWYEDVTGTGNLIRVTDKVMKQYGIPDNQKNRGYPYTPAYNPNQEGMEYLFQTMKMRKSLWFEPYQEVGLNVTAVSYAVPLIIDNTVIGVVGTDINFKNIKKTIEEMHVYKSGYAFLMSENYDILVHPNYKVRTNLNKIDNEQYTQLINHIEMKPSGVIEYKDGKRNVLLSYCKLSNDWTLVLVPSEKEIYKPVRDLTVFIILLTFAGIVISIFIAFIFSKKVSKTMDQAAKQLRYIEIGDFSQEIPDELLNCNDDLGHFIKSVHTLQNVIKDLMRTLETKETGMFSDSALISRALEKTQKASSNAAMAIEQISLDRIEKEENLRETLKRLEEFNAGLQIMIKEEVQKNRQKDAIVIYQSRLAKMGEMIGNIAHQWRQPLNSLSITLSELKDSYIHGDLDRQHFEESVEMSKQIIKRMSQTIDDFRDYLNPSKEIMPFSVYQSVLFSLNLMEQSIRSNNIHVETDLISDAYVLGYQNEFSQVLSNILSNAKDALEEIKKAKRVIKAEIRSDADFVIIDIYNNGPRISSEVMAKMFTPYFTTKTLGKGTGIGLYMSKIIIEEHMNGKIIFQNTSKGVCCSITLPIIGNNRL